MIRVEKWNGVKRPFEYRDEDYNSISVAEWDAWRWLDITTQEDADQSIRRFRKLERKKVEPVYVQKRQR